MFILVISPLLEKILNIYSSAPDDARPFSEFSIFNIKKCYQAISFTLNCDCVIKFPWVFVYENFFNSKKYKYNLHAAVFITSQLGKSSTLK